LAVTIVLGAFLKGNSCTVIILEGLWTSIEQNNNAKPETLFVSVDSGIRIKQSYNEVESTHNARVCCADLLARTLTVYEHISLVVSAMKEKQYHFLYQPRFCTCIFITIQANAHIPVEGDTDNIHHSPYVTEAEC
jgi:hypothetical protein